MLIFPLLSKDISIYKLKVVYILTARLVQAPERNTPCTVTSELFVPINNCHPNRRKQYAGNKMSEYKAKVQILSIQTQKQA